MITWNDVSGDSFALDVQVADEQPVGPSSFHTLFARVREEPFAVLLDSASDDAAAQPSRQSIIAFGPRAALVAWSSPLTAAGEAELELHVWADDRSGPAADVRRYRGAPFAELERLLQQASVPAAVRAQVPLRFVGGAIGFVGYDAARFIERLPDRAQRDLKLPELCFAFVDAALVWDHATALARWVVSARGASPEDARARCAIRMKRVRERFSRPEVAASGPGPAASADSESCMASSASIGRVHAYADAALYAEMVRSARARIVAGDAFEVCTSHRLEAAFPCDRGAIWRLYEALRAQSPAPFACCVLTPWASLVSSSPERFLSLSADGWAESRPIKGTRPRGASREQDALLQHELRGSEKDRAENVMIVDLVRNDLGRVCAVDSVHVPELMLVEAHPHVFQLVSTVRGRIDAGVSAVQLFAACFPPGSMTGAPKIEAMKIIDALEPYRRGIYAGAVGYFDAGGAMDFSVVIRSFVISDGRCTFSVGGAVVADSDPEAEYRESMDKARALLLALEQLRGRADEAADPR